MIVQQSAAIKTILEAMVDDDNNRIIGEVVEYPTNAFDSYPGICITPDEAEPERITITQNRVDRTYRLMIFIPILQANGVDDTNTAWMRLREVVDLVSAAIRDSNNLGGATQILLPTEITNYDEPITGSGGNAITELIVRTRDVESF